MRIDKSTYRIFGDYVKYEPVAQSDIKRALEDAKEIAIFEKLPVKVHINDIVLTVTKNSNVETLMVSYLSKLEKKHKEPYVAASQIAR